MEGDLYLTEYYEDGELVLCEIGEVDSHQMALFRERRKERFKVLFKKIFGHYPKEVG